MYVCSKTAKIKTCQTALQQSVLKQNVRLLQITIPVLLITSLICITVVIQHCSYRSIRIPNLNSWFAKVFVVLHTCNSMTSFMLNAWALTNSNCSILSGALLYYNVRILLIKHCWKAVRCLTITCFYSTSV